MSVTCPDCQGEGIVPVAPDALCNAWTDQDCPTCNGSQQITDEQAALLHPTPCHPDCDGGTASGWSCSQPARYIPDLDRHLCDTHERLSRTDEQRKAS